MDNWPKIPYFIFSIPVIMIHLYTVDCQASYRVFINIGVGVQKTILTMVLVSSIGIASAQFSTRDMQLWQSITDQKAKHYREKLLSDQQITANQEHYDVTYYDLNLILEPSTEFIYGNVEVAGVVVTTDLDLVQ